MSHTCRLRLLKHVCSTNFFSKIPNASMKWLLTLQKPFLIYPVERSCGLSMCLQLILSCTLRPWSPRRRVDDLSGKMVLVHTWYIYLEHNTKHVITFCGFQMESVRSGTCWRRMDLSHGVLANYKWPDELPELEQRWLCSSLPRWPLDLNLKLEVRVKAWE